MEDISEAESEEYEEDEAFEEAVDKSEAILGDAMKAFPFVYGARLREQRLAVGMPPEILCLMLTGIGIALTPEELDELEQGKRPEALEVRLFIALAFLLEMSVDQVMVACIQPGLEGADTSV